MEWSNIIILEKHYLTYNNIGYTKVSYYKSMCLNVALKLYPDIILFLFFQINCFKDEYYISLSEVKSNIPPQLEQLMLSFLGGLQ